MSVAIPRHLINEENFKIIRKSLYLQPKDNNYARKNVYSAYNTSLKDPVIFYHIDDNYIYLPYNYASVMLSNNSPNNSLNHPLIKINFQGDLLPHQIPVEEEAWQQLQQYRTTTLSLYTSFGKTILAAKLASRINLLTCVLVTRKILTVQWKKTFTDFTDAKVWIVGEKPPNFAHIIVCMDTQYDNLPIAYRNKIGLLIIDEAHLFCTGGRVGCLLAFHPNYIIAETATLTREDDEMHIMIQLICGMHNITRISSKPFHVVCIHTSIIPLKQQNKMGMTDWAFLLKSILFNEDRNRLIIDIIRQNINFKILILTTLVDHVELLYQVLYKLGESVDSMAGNKKTYKDSRVLIGTLSKISTGFDEKMACPDFSGMCINMVIIASPIKKISLLEQSVGRGFRSDTPNVIHLVDDDEICKRQWRLAKKWYLSRSGIIDERKPS